MSRRAVLRGAGVALTLPWLESLLPRAARAQSIQQPPRFLPIYLPSGAPELWTPPSVGSGAAWKLSSVLEPLTPLKSKLSVISGFENGSVFNVGGSASVEPAHGRQMGAWLTCQDARAIMEQLGGQEANGVSFDQLLATFGPAVGDVMLASMQVGLSSCKGSCDGTPCSLTRSISWRTQTQPTYKLVDPKQVFNQLVGAGGSPPTPSLDGDPAVHQSVLDAVLESALTVRGKLGSADQQRMDEYLDAVRQVEKRATMASSAAAGCGSASPPNFPDIDEQHEFRQTTAEYDRGRHADLMADLIALAFQCNLTRIVSYMLDDEYSEFVYDNIPRRTFTAEGSVPASGTCGTYSGAQHGSQDEYASIVWWHVGKVAELCQKLDRIDDGGGRSVLDNTVVFFGSCMHGSDHRCDRLPAVLIGGGGGALRQDQHVDLVKRPLRDLYWTLARAAFGMKLESFGVNRDGAAHAAVTELLAT
jgi:hypothetical protein